MIDSENGNTDDETIDIQTWPVIELVGRAVSLASVARRGMLEVDDQRDVFDVETDRFDLSTWSRTELQAWISDPEQAMLNAPIGDLSDDALADCDNALHSATAIAWALRAVDTERLALPQDNEQAQRTLDWAPQPWMKVRQLQSRVRLRSDEDLAAERECWELWYWRSTQGDEEPEALGEVVEEVNNTGLIRIVEGDFATDEDVPYANLDTENRDDVAWVSELRLRALNWVCGFGPTWEAAPLYLED